MTEFAQEMRGESICDTAHNRRGTQGVGPYRPGNRRESPYKFLQDFFENPPSPMDREGGRDTSRTGGGILTTH